MVRVDSLTPHPIAEMFPMMSDAELNELASDIKANGVLEPIMVYKELIIDGRNRLAACKLASVTPRFTEWANGDVGISGYIISKNLHRRHLTTSQRAAIAVKLMPTLKAEAKQRQREHGGTTQGRTAKVTPVDIYGSDPSEARSGEARLLAANALGVSTFSVQQAKVVHESDPAAFERIMKGKSTVNQEYRCVKQKREDNGEPTGKRQTIVENAAKNRMAVALQTINGHCTGLAGINIEALRNSLSQEELKTWADIVRSITSKLRSFMKSLEDSDNGR